VRVFVSKETQEDVGFRPVKYLMIWNLTG